MEKLNLKIVAVVLGVALLGGIYWLATPKGSAKVQIEAVLHDALESSRAGKAGSFVDLLSHAFEVDGAKPQKRDIADIIRRFRPDCTASELALDIGGTSAKMQVRVHLASSIVGAKIETDIPSATLEFRKEAALAWGFIPVQAWKLSRIEVPEQSGEFPQLSGWIGGLDN